MEGTYRQLARDLEARFGPLQRVEYLSHYPAFEMNIVFERSTVFSGQRTGSYDIHFLTLGYVGEGPRYARAFLNELGFSLSTDQIESINPGDVIERELSNTIIRRGAGPIREKVCAFCEKTADEGGWYILERRGKDLRLHHKCYVVLWPTKRQEDPSSADHVELRRTRNNATRNGHSQVPCSS